MLPFFSDNKNMELIYVNMWSISAISLLEFQLIAVEKEEEAIFEAVEMLTHILF